MTGTTEQVHTVLDSPVGQLTLCASGGVLTGLFMNDQRHRPPTEAFGATALGADTSPFAEAAAQLTAYFDGRLRRFELPVATVGSPFQRRVWAALSDIPYGETVSYGELAAQLGHPAAARAVGMACGRNRIGIIVPCHRVVGSTGKLTGYAGGVTRKQQLLALEQRDRAAALF